MYAKVFAQIFDSSIANDYRVRQFFMDLLVLAESDGVVDMTQEAISNRTRIPLPDVIEMLRELCKPDPRSRTKEHEGKRLIPIDEGRDWGWRIVNYESYRNIRDEGDRKSYMRSYMRVWRKQRKQALTDVSSRKPMQKQKQKQKHMFIKPTMSEMELYASKIGLPIPEINAFFDHHEARGWKFKTGLPMRNWQAAMRTWKVNHFKWNTPNANRNYQRSPGQNPRDAGIVKGPTDYEAAFKRKAEGGTQGELAGDIPETGSESSSTGGPSEQGL